MLPPAWLFGGKEPGRRKGNRRSGDEPCSILDRGEILQSPDLLKLIEDQEKGNVSPLQHGLGGAEGLAQEGLPVNLCSLQQTHDRLDGVVAPGGRGSASRNTSPADGQ